MGTNAYHPWPCCVTTLPNKEGKETSAQNKAAETTKTAETTKAADTNTGVNTGDQNHMVVYMIVMLAALVGITGVVARKRQSK